MRMLDVMRHGGVGEMRLGLGLRGHTGGATLCIERSGLARCLGWAELAIRGIRLLFVPHFGCAVPMLCHGPGWWPRHDTGP